MVYEGIFSVLANVNENLEGTQIAISFIHLLYHRAPTNKINGNLPITKRANFGIPEAIFVLKII